MKKDVFRKAGLALFFVTALAWAFCEPAYSEVVNSIVKSIKVEGNKKIDTQSIKAKLSTKTGAPLLMESIRQDIRTLYEVGYFDDVRVDVEQEQSSEGAEEGRVILYFVLVEKPSLTKVEFAGNKELSEEKIKENVLLSPGAMADSRLIDDNAEKIRFFYETEGYWQASVFPILRIISKDEATVTFQINEGEKVKVKNLDFEGNEALTDSEILAVMETKPAGLLSFITGSGKYVREAMRNDLERIKNLYHNNGYIAVKASDPEIKLSDDRKTMDISVSISEGELFYTGDVSVAGPEKIKRSKIEELIKLKSGDVFRGNVLRSDILSITDYYSDRGYAFADVVPDLNILQEEKTVNIVITVAENSLVRVGKLSILGNEVTRDKVIRREVRLDEGDIYLPRLLRRSYERINNLNYFETVEMVPKPRPDEGLMDLDIKVDERSTGSMTMGGGYSSIDGLLATLEIVEGNLFGRGYTLKLKGEKSGRTNSYSLSFKEPWLNDKPTSLNTSIYDQQRYYFDYSRRAKGFGVTVGKELSEYVSGSIGYNLENVEIIDVADNASIIIKQQGAWGTRLTSKVSLSLLRDSRDNYLYPRRGSRHSISAAFAGLGGENSFYRTVLDSSLHFPLFKSSAFSVRGRLGLAEGLFGEDLPLYERFYVGGVYTVRGLDYGAAGPIDDETREEFGGNKELIFNVEYTTPLVLSAQLYGVVFYDIGAGFDDDEPISWDGLRHGAGVGFRWISPIGPLRLEWGKNIFPDKGRNEPDSRWEFTFGTFF